MYPKLNNERVSVDFNQRVYQIPREKIAAAFAGAMAAKECMLWELNAALLGRTTFKEQWDKAYPACIIVANKVGLSATVDTLDFWNPSRALSSLIKDRLKHKDNPFYPFFEED